MAKKIVRLTESDMNRLVKKIIKEGVTIEAVPSDYDDVAKNMRPGTQTSATLYFDENKNIMMRIGSANLYLFAAPSQPSSNPQPSK